MSIPYLVHKEDADRYDAIRKEFEPFRVEVEQKYSNIMDKELNGEEFSAEIQAVSERYNKKYNEIVQRHLPEPRVISGLKPNPPDIENWYSYIAGIRWGNASDKELNIINTIPNWAKQKANGE